MGIYTGKDTAARAAKKAYFGVDGVARQVKKGYIGVNGVARQFFGSEGSGHFEIEAISGNPVLMSIAYGNGKYAGAYSLRNQYDGLYLGDDLLTLEKSPVYDQYEEVLFGNGVFIATSLMTTQSKNPCRVVYSDGTAEWAPAETAELNQYEWGAAGFGNGVFVLIGTKESGSNKILASATSVDGKNWLFHEIETSLNSGYIHFLRFYHGVFILYAELRSPGRFLSERYLLTSTDGKTWDKEKGPLGESGDTTNLAIDYLAYAGSTLVATQTTGSIFTFQALDPSRPGLFIKKPTLRTDEILPGAYWRHIGRDDLIYITFSGYGNNGANSYFAYSKDGLKWQYVKIPNVQQVNNYIGYANERHFLRVVNEQGELQYLAIRYIEE